VFTLHKAACRKVRSQLAEQELLFGPVDRIGLACSFVLQELNEWSLRQPRQRRAFVAPQTRSEIQDPPRHRQIPVDGPSSERFASLGRMLPPRVDVRAERVVVNAVDPYISDKWVQILQRPRIPFNASLPSKLVEVSRRSFSEFPAWPCSVDRGLSDLLDPPREIPCGFLFIACSSAFAKAAESFDAFVDVPLKRTIGPEALLESWNSCSRHSCPSFRKAGRP
jgi:hypothetical protein